MAKAPLAADVGLESHELLQELVDGNKRYMEVQRNTMSALNSLRCALPKRRDVQGGDCSIMKARGLLFSADCRDMIAA